MHMFSPFNQFVIAPQTEEDLRSASDLFDRLTIEVATSEYAELGVLLAFLNAVYRIHQSNHWRCGGVGFYGDHLMFQKLYEKMADEIDTVAERAIGKGDTQIVDPMTQSRMQHSVCQWICGIYGSEGDSARDYIALSLAAEECLMSAIEMSRISMQNSGCITTGIENMLDDLADAHESSQYLLRRALDNNY